MRPDGFDLHVFFRQRTWSHSRTLRNLATLKDFEHEIFARFWMKQKGDFELISHPEEAIAKQITKKYAKNVNFVSVQTPKTLASFPNGSWERLVDRLFEDVKREIVANKMNIVVFPEFTFNRLCYRTYDGVLDDVVQRQRDTGEIQKYVRHVPQHYLLPVIFPGT